MIHRRPVTMLFAVALSLAGCSSAGTSSSTTTSASNLPSCSSVLRDGATVTDALIDSGCLDANGAKRLGEVKPCKSGQRLWEMDTWIGLSGEPMVTADAAGSDGLTGRQLYQRLCK